MTIAQHLVLITLIALVILSILSDMSHSRKRSKLRRFLEDNTEMIHTFKFKKTLMLFRTRNSVGVLHSHYQAEINGVLCNYYEVVSNRDLDSIAFLITKRGEDLLTQMRSDRRLFDIE